MRSSKTSNLGRTDVNYDNLRKIVIGKYAEAKKILLKIEQLKIEN